MTPRQHIWVLRFSVIGVAAFAFMFSLLFQQTQYIALWWALTAGVFTGGAGAAIIGGLYWKKGTASAAWAAAITGSVMSLVGIVLTNRISWRSISGWANSKLGLSWSETPWLNGIEMAFVAACSAMAVYVIVSLLTSREDYNLDKMLHRGIYADGYKASDGPVKLSERFKLRNILKFDSNFSLSDKLVSGGIFWWSMLLLAINIVISIWHAFSDWPVSWWSRYWMITAIGFPFAIALVTLFWFGIGGVKDMVRFFHDLKTMKRDVRDDGRVEHSPADVLPASMRPPALETPSPETAAAAKDAALR
jgi:SSS family solute:Na+ symporter